MDSQRLARHIAELCKAFKVKLVVRAGMSPDRAGAGISPKGKHFIRVYPIIDECTYAAALHELGHCVDPRGMLHHEHTPLKCEHCGAACRVPPTGIFAMRCRHCKRRFHPWVVLNHLRQPASLRDVHLRIEVEEAAWAWAKHFALEWTPNMQRTMDMTFETYQRWAQRFLPRRS